MKKEIKYEDALHELEEISRNMESGEYDVDELATQLKKAQKLIKLCRDKLTKTDQEIQKILSEEK
ncbi:MAG: exodeoxyribonuclease VII small subunit [Prevotella sp.]